MLKFNFTFLTFLAVPFGINGDFARKIAVAYATVLCLHIDSEFCLCEELWPSREARKPEVINLYTQTGNPIGKSARADNFGDPA